MLAEQRETVLVLTLAAGLGLVGVDEAIAYALDLARNCSPTSMAVIKSQMQRHLAATFAEAVADSDRLMLESFGWPDLAEGVTSYRERRAATFPPLMLPSFASGVS